MDIIPKALLTGAAFGAADFLYNGVLRKDHNNNFFATINGSKPGVYQEKYPMLFGLIIWLLIGFGIQKFVVPLSSSALSALLNGALFGFILYGVYDLTNKALVKNWTYSFSFQDIAWGTALTALVSAAAYGFQRLQ